MNAINTQDIEELTKSYKALISSQQSLLLSTASLDNQPDISYAPFVRDHAGIFYIYVSELASHTANLLQNSRASILFIRPENESKNLFARERIVMSCNVLEIFRNHPEYSIQLSALQTKFGDTVGLLQTLPDFHLFSFRPVSGRYVVGFGRAFNINVIDGNISPIQH